jgi:PAT family beta-lactamase induction signal transducer AmpG
MGGLILIGVSSSFSLMLSERGVSVSTVTNVLLATIPYSWKFAISPFIKNLIQRYSSSQFNIVKIISSISQYVMLLGFSSLGFFEKTGSLLLVGFIILLTVFAVSINDILRAHIKLVLFDQRDLGFVSIVENTGFRIGMFIAGACVIYIAEMSGWKEAFMLVGSIITLAAIPILFMKNDHSQKEPLKNDSIKSLKDYFLACSNFLRNYGIVCLVCLLISFKTTDSCINGVKSSFLHYIGISRLAFANMSHLIGTFSMVIGGIVAGVALYKMGSGWCVRTTFLMQMISSLIFIYFSAFNPNLATITTLVNVSTFIFGFSGVVFRTFVAEEAKRDVNMYVMLLSIGSLIRILSYSFAGNIVENYSWEAVYFLCLISNIPGYFLYSKLHKK